MKKSVNLLKPVTNMTPQSTKESTYTPFTDDSVGVNILSHSILTIRQIFLASNCS